jgi:RHS repeat-associated protein
MILMPGLKGKYDAWNRLVEVHDSNDNLIASYEYNGLNQRIKKTVGTTVTKSFFNENWQEVESITNNQVTSYVWGLRYIDDLVLREKGEERLYSLADPNWNVIAICDNSGNIQERYIYDAFGKRNVFDANFTTKADTEFDWNRVFTGQVIDSETGLMLYRNRYLKTKFGVFISRDPITYEGDDVNLYRYVFNFAVNGLDTLGLQNIPPDIYIPPFPGQPNFPKPTNAQLARQVCNDFLAQNKGVAGTVICANGEAFACVKPSTQYPKIPHIDNIITQCRAEHEMIHVADTKCPPCGVGTVIVDDPVFRLMSEVKAWTTSHDCLQRALKNGTCDKSASCKGILQQEINAAISQIKSYTRQLEEELKKRKN